MQNSSDFMSASHRPVYIQSLEIKSKYQVYFSAKHPTATISLLSFKYSMLRFPVLALEMSKDPENSSFGVFFRQADMNFEKKKSKIRKIKTLAKATTLF